MRTLPNVTLEDAGTLPLDRLPFLIAAYRLRRIRRRRRSFMPRSFEPTHIA
jgi:hypothetical protein